MALNISKKISPADINSSAKGDIPVSTGTDIASLPTGSDGQVLTVASATAEGVEWTELGGLNLTETRYITTITIDKTYPGSGIFSNDIPGAIDFLGRGELDPPNPYTDPEGSGVDFIVNGLTGTYSLADKNYAINTASVSGIGQGIVIDLNKEAYINPTHVGWRTFNSSRIYDVDASIDAVSWDNLGTFTTDRSSSGNITTLNTSSKFYRYFRFQQTAGVGSTGFSEVEVYGNIVITAPTYNILDADNNKILLVPFGNATTINMPTGIGANGFTCQITGTVGAAHPITINPLAGVTFIGQNFVIDNVGEVATLYQVSTDTYVVSVSRGKLPLTTKGDILSHDGSELAVQAIGSDNTVLTADSAESTGVAWKDINTIVSTPFTSQRLDVSSTLQLTSSNARYLYLAAIGGTQDVVLTDPPSTNDYFYIVNRDGANPIQIKETVAGGVIQTINSGTPAVQCHYDGTEWHLIL